MNVFAVSFPPPSRELIYPEPGRSVGLYAATQRINLL